MKKPVRALGGFLILFVCLSLACILASPRSFVEAFQIPGSSMAPTLIPGDHVLVNKLAFGFMWQGESTVSQMWAKPQRRDIVVLTREDEPMVNIIKRVMAVSGDLVQVKDGAVYINDSLFHRYVSEEEAVPEVFDFGPTHVPDQTVFVLGDNFLQSKDSRFWKKPFVSMKRIKGKAWMVYFNTRESGRAGKVLE